MKVGESICCIVLTIKCICKNLLFQVSYIHTCSICERRLDIFQEFIGMHVNAYMTLL